MSSATSTDGFRISHFFVLLSLLAATVAVVMIRPSAPESLILTSLTIGAAGGAAFCCYKMLLPLVSPQTDADRRPIGDRLRADLEREKALTLRSIKELEFDRAMGKVSQQDFDQMAGRLRARAMGIMKQLDAGSSAYRERIEKELAERIGEPIPSASRGSGPDRQVGRATSQQPPDSKTRDVKVPATAKSLRCACGTPNDPDARFCKSCGSTLVPA